MSPEPSTAPPVAPEPGHRHLTIQHLTIQMEIAGIPTVVDSGGGIGHISPQEPPSQPNTPTLRAPFTGLNEKLVKVQRCPATVGPGCTRSRGESGLRLAGMFRPSRKGAGIAGTIAMRSAPYGAGRFLLGAPGVFGKVKGINWVPVCSARERAVPDKDAEAICKQRCQSSGI